MPGCLKSRDTDKSTGLRVFSLDTDGSGHAPAYKRIGPRALAVEATPCPSSFGTSTRHQRLGHRDQGAGCNERLFSHPSG